MQHRNSLTRCRSPAFRGATLVRTTTRTLNKRRSTEYARIDQIKAKLLGDVPQRIPLGRKMSDYLPALPEASQPAKPQLSLCLSRGATYYLNSIPQTAHAHVRDIHDAWAGVTEDAINLEGWEPVDEEPVSYEELERAWDYIDPWEDATDEEIAYHNYRWV